MSSTLTCPFNQQHKFQITDKDLAFYEKMGVPMPTLCPDCRQQRRLTWRNERKLYNRKCDLCGSQIISIFSADKKFPVYCNKCWTSDKWDPLSFGQEFDFNRPFFDQFQELMQKVPVLALNMHLDNENCEYAHLCSGSKNCYLVFASSFNEDCYYTTYIQRCKNIVDCFFIFDSELCYECIDCYNCYNLRYSQYSQNCRDSYFLYDCRSCSDCFGCVSLQNKQYYIFNQPYSKEDYQKKVSELLSNKQWYEAGKKKFEELKKKLPHKYYAGISNENVTGDHISFSKNAENSFDCTYLEDCKFCTWFHRAKDCYDCYAWGYPAELGYENQLCGNGFYNVKFSAYCTTDIRDLTYCYYCFSSESSFGCIALRKKKFCILNKQYSEEEYNKLVPKIIEHMGKTPQPPLSGGPKISATDGSKSDNPLTRGQGVREWGEFFPTALSPFAYNETVANEYFPLEKEDALKLGAAWKEDEAMVKYEGEKVAVPEKIEDVKDDIIKQILTCETCGKNYRLVAQELKFYRDMGISVPRNCFNCRYKARFDMRNPRKLWDRKCMKCSTIVKTTYAPERPEIIYCEKCYQEAVY